MHQHLMPTGDVILFNPLSDTVKGAIVEGQYISGHGVIVPGRFSNGTIIPARHCYGAPVLAPQHIRVDWLRTQEENILTIRALQL